MKNFIRDYFNALMYTICGILIILGSYNILLNINHMNYLNEKVMVSDIDNNYKIFKNNILMIEKNIENSNDKSLSSVLSLIKKDGIYQLLPGDKLTYMDLYNLNNYFTDTLVNNGWIANLKLIKKYDTQINNELINSLVESSNYVGKELLNNSNFHYDVKNNDIRSTINEEYQLILNNYKEYSYLILEISKKLGDIDV